MKRHRIANLQGLSELLGVSLSTVKRQYSGNEAPTQSVLAGLHCRLGLRLDKAVIFHDPHAIELKATA
jgi:hypothetical protein